MGRREHKIVLFRGTGLEREIESTIFQRRGFRILAAGTGAEALTLAEREGPDLVVLGFDMPDLTGPEVCAELKSADATRSIPVVIVSDHELPQTSEACTRAGADALISRASDRQQTMEVMARLLGIAPRRPIRMTVTFDVVTESGRKQFVGRAVNLSETGIAIEVNRPYPVDESLVVRFLLPGERKSIQAGARIRWIRERSPETWAMGLEFTAVPEPQRQLLNGFVDASLTSS